MNKFWIAVRDASPSNYGRYLVYDGQRVREAQWVEHPRVGDRFENYGPGDKYPSVVAVTHWMALPAPPANTN